MGALQITAKRLFFIKRFFYNKRFSIRFFYYF